MECLELHAVGIQGVHQLIVFLFRFDQGLLDLLIAPGVYRQEVVLELLLQRGRQLLQLGGRRFPQLLHSQLFQLFQNNIEELGIVKVGLLGRGCLL